MIEILNDETALLNYASELAKQIQAPSIIYLQGPLGAGKTTLTRGLLRAWGYEGTVKSPTFTLVESYEFSTFSVHHFDLYRIRDPEELVLIGVRDYCNSDSICIFEWPECAQGQLVAADFSIEIQILDEGCRKVVLTI